jgi:hypothetical protein
MKWYELFNPFKWSELALKLVGGAILFIALAFLGNWWLEDYYTKDLKEAQAQATAKADAIVTARNLENERRKNEALTAQKQKLESNLADARSADAASASLLNNLRTIQNGSQNDLTACRNYANSTTELFIAIDEYASWLAKEADGHALDKKACYDAWPR